MSDRAIALAAARAALGPPKDVIMTKIATSHRRLTIRLKVAHPHTQEEWQTQRTFIVPEGWYAPKQVFEKINEYLDEITGLDAADGGEPALPEGSK